MPAMRMQERRIVGKPALRVAGSRRPGPRGAGPPRIWARIDVPAGTAPSRGRHGIHEARNFRCPRDIMTGILCDITWAVHLSKGSTNTSGERHFSGCSLQ